MKKLPALALAAGLTLTGITTPALAVEGIEKPAPNQCLSDYMNDDNDAQWDRLETFLQTNYARQMVSGEYAESCDKTTPAPDPEPTGPRVVESFAAATSENTMLFRGKVAGYPAGQEFTFRSSAWELTDQAGYPVRGTADAEGNLELEARDFNNTDPKFWQLEVGGSTWKHGEVIAEGELSDLTDAPIEYPIPDEDTPSADPTGDTGEDGEGTDTVSDTGGSGGEFTDRQAVEFTAEGRTSEYHVWASHIDPDQPIGLMAHLHGDGAYEFENPDYGVVQDYLDIAKEHNAILIVPLTPNEDQTWWTDDSASDWFAGLVRQVQGDYPIDLNDVWLTGFSGGAQALSGDFIPEHHDLFEDGGAVIVGGGTPGGDLAAVAEDDGEAFELHFLAGTDDRGNDAEGFDAFAAAQRGAEAYKEAGFATSLFTDIPGEDHNESANNGPAHLAELRASN